MSPNADKLSGSFGPGLAFDALAEPVRRQILAVLAERGECSAGEIADQIQSVGRTSVSMHLTVLRTAGLVTDRRDGRYRYYTVDSAGTAAEVLAVLRDLFQGSLDEARAASEPKVADAPSRSKAG